MKGTTIRRQPNEYDSGRDSKKVQRRNFLTNSEILTSSYRFDLTYLASAIRACFGPNAVDSEVKPRQANGHQRLDAETSSDVAAGQNTFQISCHKKEESMSSASKGSKSSLFAIVASGFTLASLMGIFPSVNKLVSEAADRIDFSGLNAIPESVRPIVLAVVALVLLGGIWRYVSNSTYTEFVSILKRGSSTLIAAGAYLFDLVITVISNAGKAFGLWITSHMHDSELRNTFAARFERSAHPVLSNYAAKIERYSAGGGTAKERAADRFWSFTRESIIAVCFGVVATLAVLAYTNDIFGVQARMMADQTAASVDDLITEPQEAVGSAGDINATAFSNFLTSVIAADVVSPSDVVAEVPSAEILQTVSFDGEVAKTNL